MGLYARRWWLEENSPTLRRAERRQVRSILARQRRDGSLGSLPATIGRLYALQLLRREAGHESDKALDWLWETGQPPQSRRASDGALYHDLLFRMKRGEPARLNRMPGTPFGRGCAGFIKTGAGILLASRFGRGREPRVTRAIRCLDDIGEARGGLWCTPACSVNLLLGLAAHPEAARSRSVVRAVRALARLQTESGSWPGLPFVPTFSALAGLDLREARTQVRRALPLVRRTQNRDGSWSRGPNREFATYLVVQAMRAIES